MTQHFETILTALADGVLTITLNRPDKLNAWTYQMGAELRAAIVAANDDPQVDALVVTGAGRAFCAGADISLVFDAQSTQTPPFRHEARTEDWVALLRRSKPTVAAINGAAIGVGLSQVLAMDQILAADNATLSLRFVKLGLVPELASSHYVAQRCGFGAASNLILTGRTVSALEAQSLRLIEGVTSPESLLENAQALARAMGENPQAATLEAKRLLTLNAAEGDIDLVLRREFAALERCYRSPEHREAIDAFMQKRAPDFRGARSR
ncbi:MAG: enoyl-CoA hydratase/isomerase family protein [Gammaproteobacteria bacterium]|nr:enoyl-CoA hydratase/isomerase family protein [Gammaproteobacteria bacterium]